MKYLDKAPFSGRPSTKEFRDNYDAIDWSDRGGAPKRPCAHGHYDCAVCLWSGGRPLEELRSHG